MSAAIGVMWRVGVVTTAGDAGDSPGAERRRLRTRMECTECGDGRASGRTASGDRAFQASAGESGLDGLARLDLRCVAQHLPVALA